MIKDLIVTFLGILMGITIYAIYLDYSESKVKQTEIRENVSLAPVPKELPKEVIEFDIIEPPKGLKAVIL